MQTQVNMSVHKSMGLPGVLQPESTEVCATVSGRLSTDEECRYPEPTLDQAGPYDIGRWAQRYLDARVGGTSPLTLQAKRGDLGLFVSDYVATLGHGDVTHWGTAETQMFLWRLRQQGRAPASLNRLLSTLRNFAVWLQTNPQSPTFAQSLPTQGVQLLPLEEPSCRRLARDELLALFEAADQAVREGPTSKRARPRRDRAILGVLLHTGLRVGEMLALTRGQYEGDRLLQVWRKGGGHTDSVSLTRACCAWVDDYLEHECDAVEDDTPLFATPDGRALRRCTIHFILNRLSARASEHRLRPIVIHPHLLRHTFGAAYREASGSDTETAAVLGHTGLRHVGRYSRVTDEQRASAMEAMFKPLASKGIDPLHSLVTVDAQTKTTPNRTRQ